MLQALKNLLGLGPKVDYSALLKQGVTIVDVRSNREYAGGHIKGSINIPVEVLSKSLTKLKEKNKAIITCCASGMRSASAKSILESNGYTQVYNGGSWSSLQSKLN